MHLTLSPAPISATAQKYYHGFDYLRAVMALAVTAWHWQIFGVSNVFDASAFEPHTLTVSDIINFQILLLAVPVFCLMSLFLFFRHYGTDQRVFKTRLKRLLYLYGFWVGLALLIYGSLHGVAALVPRSLADGVIKLVSGWFTLYYFFFALTALTGLACLCVRLPVPILWLLTLLSALVLLSLTRAVGHGSAAPHWTAFWNPINFVPYVFIAGILASDIKAARWVGRPAVVILMGVGMVACALWEWQWMPALAHFPFNFSAMPSYSRLSVVLGATLLLSLSLSVKHPPPPLIGFLARNSLGLYCLHGLIGFMYVHFWGFPEQLLVRIPVFAGIVITSLVGTIVLRRLLGPTLI